MHNITKFFQRKKSGSFLTKKDRQFPFPIHHNPIEDDYIVSEETLGVGINGKVVTCWHRQTKRKCALKILRDSDKARREIITHKKASEGCEYIVQVLDIYENNYRSIPCLHIVMECMEGGELFDRIRRRQDKPFTEREAAKIVTVIAKAVAHLHRMNIAHRDLKPENLLFTSSADDAVLKLTDFGFAKEGPLNTPCYSIFYAAPEILSNEKYDKTCDIWSLGVIMYILLCGYPPFYNSFGSNNIGLESKIKAGEYQFPNTEWKFISQDAKNMIRKMLTVDPSARVTIDWVLECPWLTGTVPETPIHIGVLDANGFQQMQAEFVAANHAQRRTDDDSDEEASTFVIQPEISQLGKRKAKRPLEVVASENISPSTVQIEEKK